MTSSQEARTSWYNYTLASAGTITGTNNTTTATQSICPKGWKLPSSTEISTLSGESGSTQYVSIFSSILGGYYFNSVLYQPTHGVWWGSTASNNALRYYLRYDGSSLYTQDTSGRTGGLYIRCVQAS